MARKPYITIIGTGLGKTDIPEHALRRIGAAEVLAGGRRQLSQFSKHRGEKIIFGKNPAADIARIAQAAPKRNTVILASGDPNFYGIAALVYQRVPKSNEEVIPNFTAFQAAFARIKEPWSGATCLSIHGRDISALGAVITTPGTHVIYCDAANTPAAAASYLVGRCAELSGCRAWIFDGLGTSDEKITRGKLKKMMSVHASPLSMLMVENDVVLPRYSPGISDGLFAHDRHMITRRDIRLMSLARLELGGCRVLWDIGAGSGSVAIEAARACPGMRVFAIERDGRRSRQLAGNIRRFRAVNVTPITGKAPEIFTGLPRPDRIFIGGSGGGLEAIFNSIRPLLQAGGLVVVNCVTMATLEAAISWFKRLRWQYEVSSVSISRLISGLKPEIFRSENPVFIVQGRAPVSS